tara:strand:- start:738 stop:1166 length:429 start_codon:yes stop_codon:yes gene_type:complete
MSLHFDKKTLLEYVEGIFPQIKDEFLIDMLEEDAIVVRMRVQNKHLRPGGTVSGPSIFALADVAVYMSVLAAIGPKKLTVTTNCSIDFMRKPIANANLIASCKLLKMGKSLAVGDVLMSSEGSKKAVARATLTYAIPRLEGA